MAAGGIKAGVIERDVSAAAQKQQLKQFCDAANGSLAAPSQLPRSSMCFSLFAAIIRSTSARAQNGARSERSAPTVFWPLQTAQRRSVFWAHTPVSAAAANANMPTVQSSTRSGAERRRRVFDPDSPHDFLFSPWTEQAVL